MSLETSRHGVQLELSRSWLVQFAQHLVFSDHPRRCHTDGRFVPASLSAVRRVARGAAVYHHILVDGRATRHARLHFGTRTDRARVAHFADAIDLPTHAQLLHLESNPARDQRRMGKLGQTRTHRQRAGARVSWGVHAPRVLVSATRGHELHMTAILSGPLSNSSRIRPEFWAFLLKYPKIGLNSR